MADIEEFSCNELMKLFYFYNKFPTLRLIERIIELEEYDRLRDILSE